MANSIRKNYLYNLSYQLIAVFVPLITTPYVSRVLGAENIGIYSYTNSLTSFFLLFASLGVIGYGTREVARERESKHERSKLFWELIVFKLIAVIVSYLAFFLFFEIKEKSNSVVYFVLSINFLTSLFDLSWFFSGMEMFKQLSLRNSAIKLLGAVSVFVFVKNKNDLLLYILCMVVPGVIGNIVLWKRAIRFVEFIPIRELDILRHLHSILVFFVPAISAQIYHTADKLMLQWILHDDFQNGYYDQANKIITVLLTTVTSYNTVMNSRMSNLFKKDGFYALETQIRKSIVFIEMIGFPMVFGLIAIAPRFVPVFFGDTYGEVIILLRIFSPMILITGLSNMIGNQFLIPAGFQRSCNKAVVYGAIINICLNALLIPAFNSVGACMATVSSEIGIFVFMCIFQKGTFCKIVKNSFNYLLGAVIMAVIIMCLDCIIPTDISVIINVFALLGLVMIGAFVYFVVLYIRKESIITSIIKKYSQGILEKENEKCRYLKIKR